MILPSFSHGTSLRPVNYPHYSKSRQYICCRILHSCNMEKEEELLQKRDKKRPINGGFGDGTQAQGPTISYLYRQINYTRHYSFFTTD